MNEFDSIEEANIWFEFDSSKLLVLSFNSRSLSSLNKFNLFKESISKIKYLTDIIIVQETWFKKELEIYIKFQISLIIIVLEKMDTAESAYLFMTQ